LSYHFRFGAVGACLALTALSLGCSEDQGRGQPAPGGYDAPVTTQLSSVVVGVVGTGILLQNFSSEKLENVEIVVSAGSVEDGFRFRTGAVEPNSTQTYLAQVFKNSAGESLNPMVVKADVFAVYADTPRGRGQWRGGYAEQR
jgi:hypothetical protein